MGQQFLHSFVPQHDGTVLEIAEKKKEKHFSNHTRELLLCSWRKQNWRKLENTRSEAGKASAENNNHKHQQVAEVTMIANVGDEKLTKTASVKKRRLSSPTK